MLCLATLVLVRRLLNKAYVRYQSWREHLPAPPPLARFPVEFDQWKLLREDPIATDIARELGADALLSRTYVETPAGSRASLFVAWFQTQRGGVRQPHSPNVCLPASGWTPEVTGEITLDTAAVVLYWYQTPRRVIAGEWAAKLYLVAGALRDQRTDTALVRVIVWPAVGRGEAATTVAIAFARVL